MSSTLYQSILLAQPADGQIVFVRRFTRDPPVRATWDASSQNFTLLLTTGLHIIGGTFAGDYEVPFLPNFAGPGQAAWAVEVAGVWLGTFQSVSGNWQLAESDLVANSYAAAQHPPPATPDTTSTFITSGAPSWSGPTTMTIDANPDVALVIPASLVSAWRPL